MAIRIWIGWAVPELRECHTGFAVDDLEEFPAATLWHSTFALAVVDDEEFTRGDVDWSGTGASEFEIIDYLRHGIEPRKASSADRGCYPGC